MAKYIQQLYYITHIDNVSSILEHGILSHRVIETEKIPFEPIYDAEIVSKRANKQVSGGKNLWDFVNLYFKPRNPMLYRVIHENPLEKIVILGVRKNVINPKGSLITNGNAANTQTLIIPSTQRKRIWAEITDNLQREWWSEEDGSKRTIMAEALVPDKIASGNITTIYTPNFDTCKKIKNKIDRDNITVIPEPNMFFQPLRIKELTKNLSLVEGDMFFSKLQTLTISVNCVGVMGKGLASRAKYQFPRVYVEYQDLCKRREIQLGKPYLYKQEMSLDQQLADEPTTLKNGTMETWFLLFPTKGDWRKRADIKGIENGIRWICTNYREKGIKSLAIPALGCGLGWLDWSEVGPIICSHLAKLDIPIQVYLPRERKIPEDLLEEEYLITE